MAGKELLSSNLRIIDLALKYGYETPESFSRAFTKFHGVTPSQARLGNISLKSFSPLSIKLILDGGNILDYRIEAQEAFRIICRKMPIPNEEVNQSTEDIIAQFWKTCILDGTITSLSKHIPEHDIFQNGIIGVSFGNDASDPMFPYAIGAHYDGQPLVDASLTIEEIPTHTYIAFTCTGKMPQAFMNLYHQVYSEFLPASDYQHCGGTDFEVYPSADVDNPHYSCEFWIAVEEKFNKENIVLTERRYSE